MAINRQIILSRMRTIFFSINKTFPDQQFQEGNYYYNLPLNRVDLKFYGIQFNITVTFEPGFPDETIYDE